jgi:hypothetical protein
MSPISNAQKDMKKYLFLFSCMLLLSVSLSAQELFPNTEPASNVPKGALGVRVFNETYQEVNQIRDMFALKLMYGLLPRLSIYATVSESNHHGVDFPPNLVSHTHSGKQSIFSTGNFQRGLVYPYQFNGVDLYAKYRFLSRDGEHSHLRMALYGEWSNVNVAHDEAEPKLMDDTKGYGGGLITTVLQNHLAVSLTAGFIIPGDYEGFSPDLLGGPMVPTVLSYGRAIQYDLSIGYLLYPAHYANYDQPNVNVYLEFLGKDYEAATVVQYGDKNVPIQTPLLQAGNYVEIHPGVQLILHSKTRFDFSMGFPFIGTGYTSFYPEFMIGIQRYFYLKKKSQ